ncbi:MAG TPA: PIG-L family deacetylase, partial [Isosphaeraceae bacterium]|nr:PIG-L family deacetylase [Isosphaeraceae bacterium]
AAPLDRIPHLYFVDPMEGVDRDGQPAEIDFFVDITQVFATKSAMLACHASQQNWLLRQHDIGESLESQARFSAHRRAEIGVEKAEAFRQYRGHPYPQDNLLLKLVGQDGRGRHVAQTAAAPGDAQGMA